MMFTNSDKRLISLGLTTAILLAPISVGLQTANAGWYDPQTGLYHKHAREYHPRLGRFLQRDPNEQALILANVMAMNGQTRRAFASMSARTQFGDGMNLYQYVRGNPPNRHDPSGLFSLPGLLTTGAIRMQIAASNLGAVSPLAMKLVGGLLMAFDLYALAQYQEVQAVFAANPNIAGALHAQFIASRIAVRGVLRTLGSIKAVQQIASGTRWLGRAAQAWVKAKMFGKTGQVHHAISTKIWRALDEHPNLKGLYAPRDARFVTQAIDKAAHNGYEKWHIALDKEIAKWIKKKREATADQFETMLRQRYKQADLKARFPDGLP